MIIGSLDGLFHLFFIVLSTHVKNWQTMVFFQTQIVDGYDYYPHVIWWAQSNL